jgi:catechol 2,3-dioxygenase-like lactoylglutathione lyase family enzyme
MTARPATGPRDQLAGRLLRRGEPGYERARVGRVFNARRPDRYPAAVLLAAGDDDVIAGVRLAAEQGWTVSVRSGGHSWAVWSLRDDALLIDLGGMRDMAYDPATGVVSARPAVQGGLELAPFLAERGRAFPGGHCATVGLGGAFDGALARGARPVMPPCPAPEPGVRMAFVADPEGNLIELLHRPGKGLTSMPIHPVMAGKFPLAFAAALALAGVDVRQVRVQAMLHGFLNLPATIEPVSDALDLIAEAVAGRVRPGAGAR